MSKGVKAPLRRLACLLPVLAVVACGGGDDPQVPTAITPNTITLTGTVGAAVSTVPTVTIKDQKGKPLAGLWVRWTPSAGKAANDSSQTDAAGSASVGSWTLGPTAGAQTLAATSSGLGAVTFTADAKAGPVSVVTQLSAPASAPVVSTLPTPPSVRVADQYGNPVANVAILFAVATGAGTITGAQQTTNAQGVATVGSWQLGTLAGPQTLRADATGSGKFTLVTANATSGAAVDMILVQGAAATGSPNKRLCTSPIVAIRDVYGNGVGQVTVNFVPANGSGTGGSGVSAANTGYATLPDWTLGSSGPQTLVATSPALPGKQVTVTTTLVPAAQFSICARFIGDGGTPRQREAVANAIARWQRVVAGHVQTSHANFPAGVCGNGVPAFDLNEDVEDLLLFIRIEPIDGVNGTIAEAGPCAAHLPVGLTALGSMRFDQADLELTVAAGTIDNVFVHEMGHMLGIGTLWSSNRSLLVGRNGLDPYFVGASAREEFGKLFGSYSGNPVPVENCVGIPGCGAGTRDAHWRRSVFGTELMQGYVNPSMLMSRVTVGSLADLGYVVNMAGADAYVPPSSVASLRTGPSPLELFLANDIADLPLYGLEKDGTHRLLRQPINPLKRVSTP